MPVEIVFETHSSSEDNGRGIATGWLPGRLSERGRSLARELGARRRVDGLAAAFTSDLARGSRPRRSRSADRRCRSMRIPGCGNATTAT